MHTIQTEFLPLNPSKKREIILLLNHIVWVRFDHPIIEPIHLISLREMKLKPIMIVHPCCPTNEKTTIITDDDHAQPVIYSISIWICPFGWFWQNPIKLFEIEIKFSNEGNPIITISQHYYYYNHFRDTQRAREKKKTGINSSTFWLLLNGCWDLSFLPTFLRWSRYFSTES